MKIVKVFIKNLINVNGNPEQTTEYVISGAWPSHVSQVSGIVDALGESGESKKKLKMVFP